MCGIAGLIESTRMAANAALSARACAMANAHVYRGPDGADVWTDAKVCVALAYRRLAILDRTSAGAQPTVSSDGRWVISYNGEVYNAEAIAADPQTAGLVRRGTSGPEVIVKSVARRGLDRTLADRHVQHRAVGPSGAHAASRARPNRHQAAALWSDKRRFLFCFREIKRFSAVKSTCNKTRIYAYGDLEKLP